MRCMNCYQEIPDSCKFCPNCGAKQPVQKMEPVSQMKEETTDNITEDTAEVQQPIEKVQSEEDVLPEEKVQQKKMCSRQNQHSQRMWKVHIRTIHTKV